MPPPAPQQPAGTGGAVMPSPAHDRVPGDGGADGIAVGDPGVQPGCGWFPAPCTSCKSFQQVVGLVGGFCKALVTRACGDGVTMPLGAPDLGEGPGPTIAYLVLVYVVRARLLDLQFVGTRKGVS
jgi:hypothetical protein